MKITIKKSQQTDLEAINQLLRLSKAYWDYDENFMDQFMQKFGVTVQYLQNNITELLYINNRLAGFYSFIDKGNEFELDNFFLHPDFIGKGVGRKLWGACCDAAKTRGKSEFIIWSDPNAEPFYLAMGCVKIGTKKSPMMPNRYPPILKYQLICKYPGSD